MRIYNNSDVFVQYNKSNAINKRIKDCLDHIKDDNILNKQLDGSMTVMLRSFRESVMHKAVEAVRKNRILLVRLYMDNKGDHRFPEILPFLKVKRKDEICTIIDVSRITTVEKDPITEEIIGYKVDIPKLYVWMVSAYISMELCGESMTLPMEAAKNLSIIWAKVFVNVLVRMGLLTGNKDRYEAFMYHAIKFYLTYYIEAQPPVVEAIATGYVSEHENALIHFMESKIEMLNLHPYNDFSTFMEVLFNNEVTGIRTQISRVNDVNQSAYLQKFITSYSKNAISILWSVDYAICILLGAYRKTNMTFDRAFEDIFKELSRNMPKLMESLFKEI